MKIGRINSTTKSREEATVKKVGRMKTDWEQNGPWLSVVGRKTVVWKRVKNRHQRAHEWGELILITFAFEREMG